MSGPDETRAYADGVTVIVTRSAGHDDAVVVFVDTDPETIAEGDAGPRIRILLNDEPVYLGVFYDAASE